ncbi:MAG: 1-deoxy-D-xylulose-5-phosphate synthase [Lysobacteraceae bacterium]|nr:MAG: 1-deoxy-D-xylulose-5-phosphate synthase [Xanthomonadaceae bacterium]
MIDSKQFPLLSKLDAPDQLRMLPVESLQSVVDELRQYLIESIARAGGHFGAGLGCVELTVALHYVFDTPDDRIVWDVGHQAYPHKILTGRRDQIESIKKKDGLAPFPKRGESEYDTFGVGHSSTSISAALGMAVASALDDNERRSVAVIGDGAMTAGLAYEALNHGGDVAPNVLVVLNQNQMSISPNVGALTRMLGRLVSGNFYTGVREQSKRVMKPGTKLYDFMGRWEEHVKGMVMPSTLFEELGFNYLGPIDGHDLPLMVKTLQQIKRLGGPKLLHVITEKGKGYQPAEKDPVKYHAVSPFDPKVGMVPSGKPSPGPSYTQVFGDWLCDQAKINDKLVGITPAMREGSGLVRFAAEFPDRYFDVGIAEQHSVTFAAGMACEGYHPVVAIYSTFLQRAYDQLIHDVAVQNLPVMFAIDRAGVVGPDGPTHAGSFDLSYLRCVPNMVVMAPADENECRAMLNTGMTINGPSAVRYPRGRGPGVSVECGAETVEIGKAQKLRTGKDVAILAFGSMVARAQEVAAEIDATVYNMRFVKPLDSEAVAAASKRHKLIVTVEENATSGGAGSAVNECLASLGLACPVLNLGLPDCYLEHAGRDELLAEAGLDTPSILAAIKQRAPWIDSGSERSVAGL